jgi:hypothetical protein
MKQALLIIISLLCPPVAAWCANAPSANQPILCEFNAQSASTASAGVASTFYIYKHTGVGVYGGNTFDSTTQAEYAISAEGGYAIPQQEYNIYYWPNGVKTAMNYITVATSGGSNGIPVIIGYSKWVCPTAVTDSELKMTVEMTPTWVNNNGGLPTKVLSMTLDNVGPITKVGLGGVIVYQDVTGEYTASSSVPGSLTMSLTLWNGKNNLPPLGYGFIYRYNNSAYGHFYTNNPAELGLGAEGYAFEGVAFIADQSQMEPNEIPLYRFMTGGRHFYSTGYAEGAGMTYEGILGWVYPTQVFGTVPLYRYSNVNNSWFYTTSYAELGANHLNGIQCYVLPFVSGNG